MPFLTQPLVISGGPRWIAFTTAKEPRWIAFTTAKEPRWIAFTTAKEPIYT